MFLVLMIVLFALTLGGFVYVVRRAHRFSFIQKIAEKNKALSWLCACVPPAVCFLFFFVNLYAVVIAGVHLILIWMLSDAIGWLIKKISRRSFRHYLAGICALVFTVIYLAVGWFNAHHVFRTDYAFETEKALGSLRIALIADSHLGITLSGEDFAREMERVNAEKPDLVVIVGDFVDDDTEKDDMLRACRALGDLETTYGVFFTYGNHDKGYFDYRNFTTEELDAALLENRVTILEDESVLLGDRFYLVGRQDRTARDRISAAALTQDLDPEKYVILLDHQPNDHAGEAGCADLVLSGHTHGGHIFPAGIIGEVSGINDRTYGTEARDGTTFVVTSGISGWGIPFKTFCISEYVVIDVQGK